MNSPSPYLNADLTIAVINIPDSLPVPHTFLADAQSIIRSYGGSSMLYSGDLVAIWPVPALGEDSRPCLAITALAKSILPKRTPGTFYDLIHIGISRGFCVMQSDGGQYTDIKGPPVTAAHELQLNAKQRGVIVLLNEAVVESCEHADIEQLSPGVFSLKYQ